MRRERKEGASSLGAFFFVRARKCALSRLDATEAGGDQDENCCARIVPENSGGFGC
jgi:hypothetical protein